MILLACGVLPAIWVKGTLAQVWAADQRSQGRMSAWAYFKERCRKNSGEKIYQVVDGVPGIFLENPPARPSERDLQDQYCPV